MDFKKKLFDLKNQKKTILDEAGAAIESGDQATYDSKMAEARARNTQIESINALLDEMEPSEPGSDPDNGADPTDPSNTIKAGFGADDKTKNVANALRAAIKACMGKKLTTAENSLLIPTSGNGTYGEGYLLPEDISTIIREKIRQYKSFREVLGYMGTTALSGSYPVENFDTLNGLVDFTDGTDGTEATDISFTPVSFSLKEKGALLSLSNTLLAMTDQNLVEYVAKCFAKKAVITENTMAITALKTGKTIKTLTNCDALVHSINVDLDEGVKYGCVIVTNQDGFDKLDREKDAFGRPLLQPVITDATKKTFKGYPVIVFSNAMLPTTGTDVKKAPVFYGNLSEAVDFVDNNSYSFALSEHAGFKSNTTIARVIEHVDVVQKDSSDKIYCYGELTVTGDDDDVVNILPVASLPASGQDATAIYVLIAADGDKASGTMWTWSGTEWSEHENA